MMNWTWILARLSEPSTWAGLAGILGAAQVGGLMPATWTTIVSVGMAAAGAVAAVKKDKGW